jgi:ABC-type microcin C transport system permease subunit YejB
MKIVRLFWPYLFTLIGLGLSYNALLEKDYWFMSLSIFIMLAWGTVAVHTTREIYD